MPSKGGRLREGSASLPSGLHSRSGHRIITARDFPPGVKGEAPPGRGGFPGNGLDSPFRTGNAVPWPPPAAQKSSFSYARDAATVVSNGLRWGSGAGGPFGFLIGYWPASHFIANNLSTLWIARNGE